MLHFNFWIGAASHQRSIIDDATFQSAGTSGNELVKRKQPALQDLNERESATRSKHTLSHEKAQIISNYKNFSL